MNENDALLTLAIKLAREAGDILREGRRDGFGAVNTKSSSVDVVTDIDRASEEHIVSVIRAQRPEDGILGEEGTSIEAQSGVRWVIDPLDGTTNFIYGIPGYAVSIGIEIDGVPAVGAVYNPAIEELFYASAGQGAFLNDEAIHVRDQTPLSHVLLATGFSYSKERREQQVNKLVRVLPQVRDIRRTGSAALDMCAVAAGRIDAYYEWGIHPWDVTAGTVILREAGGIATDFDGAMPTHTVLAASNTSTHASLHKLLKG